MTQRCVGGSSATSARDPWAPQLGAASSKALGSATVGSAQAPSPLQRSSSSFSTCGRRQWVFLHQRWLIFLQYLKQK